MHKFDHFETLYPKVVEIPGKKGICYWLREDIVWVDADGERYYIPKGFISDGYSIPSVARGVVRNVKSRLPAYMHDKSYLLADVPTRRIADRNIQLAMRATGTNWYSALKVRIGLLFGGKAWNRYTKLRREIGYENLLKMKTADNIETAIEIAATGLL